MTNTQESLIIGRKYLFWFIVSEVFGCVASGPMLRQNIMAAATVITTKWWAGRREREREREREDACTFRLPHFCPYILSKPPSLEDGAFRAGSLLSFS
jgi:hypothetical protein